MLVGSLVDHLIHPLTYTTSQGEVKHLSTKDISHVVQLILSGLVIAIVEAVCSSRSLKSSCISVVIIVAAAFYHGAAAMKIAHGCAELEVKASTITEDGLSTQAASESTQELHQDLKPVTSTPVQQPELVGNAALPKNDPPLTSSTPASSTNGSSTQELHQDSKSVTSPQVQEPEHVDNAALQKNDPLGTSSTPEPSTNASQPIPTPASAAIAEPQQATAERKSYQELAPTTVEAQTIYNMIHTIGSFDTPMLYFKKTQLINWGKSIAHVHPLKFLETVLKNAVLKKSMRDIESGFGGLKWKGFLQGEGESLGFAFKCQREDDAGNFAPYLRDFCTAVKIEFKKVNPLVKVKNWEEFIRFLINN